MSFADLAAQNAREVFDALAEDGLLQPAAGGGDVAVRVIIDMPARAQGLAGMDVVLPEIVVRFLHADISPARGDQVVSGGRRFGLLGEPTLTEDGTIWEFSGDDLGAA